MNALTPDQVARLYDALHALSGEAGREYLAAEHVAPEEYARGRRDGLDRALDELDALVFPDGKGWREC